MSKAKTWQVPTCQVFGSTEAPGGFGPPIRVLQTLALPLGHGASEQKYT
jgi:hypothetical protein